MSIVTLPLFGMYWHKTVRDVLALTRLSANHFAEAKQRPAGAA